MRDVIIASANRKSAEHIKSILQRDLIFVSEIYQSGAEVLSYASIRPDAVVVCGRLSDGLPAVSLAETYLLLFIAVRRKPRCAIHV